MKIDGNQIKIGNIIKHKDKLWKTIKTQHTQPGKGGAYLQVELKEIANGTKLNARFRSSEEVEKIRLEEKEFQYLYKDEKNYFFMDNNSYEQMSLNQTVISSFQEKFLKENSTVIIETYEDNPISIKLPDSVSLEVVETDTVIKGQTATSSYKPAILENKIKVLVPPHITTGDNVIINTTDGKYVEKSKN